MLPQDTPIEIPNKIKNLSIEEHSSTLYIIHDSAFK